MSEREPVMLRCPLKLAFWLGAKPIHFRNGRYVVLPDTTIFIRTIEDGFMEWPIVEDCQ